jgi:tripartite-type tricarboxylate transporter receptor subunit TctC
MHSLLRTALATATAAGFAVLSLPGLAQTQQNFPTKPIHLIVPTSAGSQTDALTRMIGAKMGERWGQAVVVVNQPGAGGMLAASTVAKAAPDGHTLLLSNGFALTAALQPTLPYDPFKDFARVAQMGYGSAVLVVAPALGVKSVKALIALAKAQPGKIILGSSGVGTQPQLSGAKFNRAAGIKVITVAFKGVSEATIEVLAGRAHYSIVPLLTALPFIKEGKLLALAVTRHSPVLPDVPVLAETLPEFKGNDNSYGLLAPAGTPPPILNQLSKEAARILAIPDIKERLQAVGFVPAPSTPEEYDKILREQIETLSKLVWDTGLRAR